MERRKRKRKDVVLPKSQKKLDVFIVAKKFHSGKRILHIFK